MNIDDFYINIYCMLKDLENNGPAIKKSVEDRNIDPKVIDDLYYALIAFSKEAKE